MKKPDNSRPDELTDLINVVDTLSDETKDLALNLALYLARVKAQTNSEQLKRMEPEFIRLVNGAVKVVQELACILNAARNEEKMVYQLPSGKLAKDHIEQKLEQVVQQCNRILTSLEQAKDIIV